MSSSVPRININGSQSPYARFYDNIPDQNTRYLGNRIDDYDRESYLHPSKYTYSRNTTDPKSKGYKYSFYKDPPAEYYYHSKDSGLDSVRSKSKSPQNKEPIPFPPYSPLHKEPVMNRSPSFRRNEYKSRQLLDSIDNVVQSHRSKYSQSNAQSYNYEAQSQEILFLKQKLIQTHHKLLKQLQQTTRLGLQLQNAQAQVQAQQKENNSLRDQVEKLKKQIQKMHEHLQYKSEKKQQKFRSLQNKFNQQSRRNVQLKDDLETMRNKMLQTLMQKNTFQQENISYKNQMNILGKNLQKFKLQIKEKDQNIQHLKKQLDILRKKYQKCEKQCQSRAEEIHQYSHLATDREKALITLQNQLKQQKDKNLLSHSQIMSLQSQHKNMMRKLTQLQDTCQKYKGQIYWFQKNKQSNDKIMIQKMEKLTEQLNQLSIRYRQKQRQLDSYRRKPIYEAQKKRKNYQHTKDFVNKLQSQQNLIGQSRVNKHQSKGSARGGGSSGSKTPNSKAGRNIALKSPINRSSIQTPISHQPVTHKQKYTEQKNKYISILDQVGELQQDLLSFNTQKKKMLNQMDKIDDTKVKTRQMISRRRRLQQQVSVQEEKIQRVKQQLRKVKAL